MKLDASTFLIQWAVGGMFGCWFTTRQRVVGAGYGWLLRSVFAVLAILSAVLGPSSDVRGGAIAVRNSMSIATAATILAVLVYSVLRRPRGSTATHDACVDGRFDPRVDLAPLVPGVAAVIAGAVAAGGQDVLAIARAVVGAIFLGFVSDAMLLGHWYLVQPGLPRRHVSELVRAFMFVWPVEVLVMLVPTGMLSVFSGSIDDGWGGVLGWFWIACALTTGILGFVTTRALQERSYSAVMAATGLMYLAILTAFGTDLVARAVLSP